ncbi:hypothetical protein VHUM_01378 [Vanrija humicola]|uniref:Uncharacterized protein n=1 Tax=Vanrija humicola TaxID=5417 RepID=A0A7D8ZUN7_VANHU|nr:hypothetical protein VHUM_01378 [Vanrija humicola]
MVVTPPPSPSRRATPTTQTSSPRCATLQLSSMLPLSCSVAYRYVLRCSLGRVACLDSAFK